MTTDVIVVLVYRSKAVGCVAPIIVGLSRYIIMVNIDYTIQIFVKRVGQWEKYKIMSWC